MKKLIVIAIALIPILAQAQRQRPQYKYDTEPDFHNSITIGVLARERIQTLGAFATFNFQVGHKGYVTTGLEASFAHNRPTKEPVWYERPDPRPSDFMPFFTFGGTFLDPKSTSFSPVFSVNIGLELPYFAKNGYGEAGVGFKKGDLIATLNYRIQAPITWNMKEGFYAKVAWHFDGLRD